EDEHAGGERPGGLAVARALDAGAEAERPAGDVLPLHAEALARLVRQARQDGPRRAGELGARLARLGAALRVERDPRARAVLHEEERLVAARRPRDVEAHPREAVLVEEAGDDPAPRRAEPEAEVEPALVLRDPVPLAEGVAVERDEVARIVPPERHEVERPERGLDAADAAEDAVRRAGDLAEELVAAEKHVRVEARHRGLVAGEVEALVGPVARRERLVEPRRIADEADRRAVRAHLDGAAAERLAERVLARPLRPRPV